jgi:hypothetical protein
VPGYTRTIGAFGLQQDQTGAYWELKAEHRSALPYFRLYNNQTSQWSDTEVQAFSELILPSGPLAGTTDSLTQYLTFQRQAPEQFDSPDGVGAYIRVEATSENTTAAGLRDAFYQSSSDPDNTRIQDRHADGADETLPRPQNTLGSTMEHDALLALRDWEVLDREKVDRYNLGRSLRLRDASGRLTNRYRYEDLPDAFFVDSYGFRDYKSFNQYRLAHELLHGKQYRQSAQYQGRTLYFGGHVDILTGLLSKSGTFAISAADVMRDQTEMQSFQLAQSRGLLAGNPGTQQRADAETQFWRERVLTYTRIIQDAAGGDVRTYADLRREASAGTFSTERGKQFAVSDNLGDARIVEDSGTDFIVFGDIDWGRVGVSAASALGSTLGRRLFGDSQVGGALAGVVFGELSSQLAAEVLKGGRRRGWCAFVVLDR